MRLTTAVGILAQSLLVSLAAWAHEDTQKNAVSRQIKKPQIVKRCVRDMLEREQTRRKQLEISRRLLQRHRVQVLKNKPKLRPHLNGNKKCGGKALLIAY
jgi:hypothetical protein